jgi:putative endonuclease
MHKNTFFVFGIFLDECIFVSLSATTGVTFRDSSMVEHSAVNRRVVGSNPTRGARRVGFKPTFKSKKKEVHEYAVLPFFYLYLSVHLYPEDAVDKADPYSLYILKSESADRYYVGISSNPCRRLEYHNTFEKGLTSRYRPWQLVYTKEYPSKSDALHAEKTVKSLKSRKMIVELIEGDRSM